MYVTKFHEIFEHCNTHDSDMEEKQLKLNYSSLNLDETFTKYVKSVKVS